MPDPQPDVPHPSPLPDRGRILRAAVGLGLYAAAFGAAFGALSTGSGLSLAQTAVLSLVMFSGASQVALVGAVGVGSPFAAIPVALLLGARNAFYGVTLSEIVDLRGWRRPVTAHFVIDETTAMAVAQPSTRSKRYAFWATGLILFTLWQVGTVLGALLGTVVDPKDFGLDAAAPAVFLALLWPGLTTARARLVAVTGALLALVLVPVLPAGLPVLAAAGVAVIAGLLRPRADRADRGAA
ncbi:4-azaleucine resistance transporter AzlC [Friedmanniella endophytica]|uniref:4-azaleucine resistance transporter AzlC n=1 Tax=Microlunatus kandeliicorticis TaxID=1759536 RepID=A0A7W3ITX8_9ACTN|nr:AzlC family ABC transporter permease [Microlunatus kandeliicorticis]MBA8795169.1 4-azaleucine resistance transporter AzlC [Microlunatus kandeliicorticis]